MGVQVALVQVSLDFKLICSDCGFSHRGANLCKTGLTGLPNRSDRIPWPREKLSKSGLTGFRIRSDRFQSVSSCVEICVFASVICFEDLFLGSVAS